MWLPTPPGREREMAAGPHLVRGIDRAVGEHGGLEPIVAGGTNTTSKPKKLQVRACEAV